jgi:hypothetical protein
MAEEFEMGQTGKRWIVKDRHGNSVYLTHERWGHIIHETNHPEMADYEACVKTTLKIGRRKQEPLNPLKYRYTMSFNDLPNGVNTIVVIVLFGFDIDDEGFSSQNNYVATAFFKHIRPKG